MSRSYRLHYAPDNASLIVRLALEQLGQPYETVLVNRATLDQTKPDYLKLNPNGLIPALETPEGAIFETGAILLWLVDRHGALGPGADSPARGEVLKWLFFTSNTLHPALRMMFYPHYYVGDDIAVQRALRRQMRSETARHLSKLNDLAGQTPFWFASETPGVLDFYVACALRWIALYPKKGVAELAIGNWPHLLTMATRLEACQCTRAAIEAEGLGDQPFTAPDYPNPPEGSAT